MHIGTIKQIWRYPVKSMGGELVNSTQIQPKGIEDDRCWSVRDDTTGELVGGRKIPSLMMLTARFLDNSVTEFGRPVKSVIEITFPSGEVLRSDDPYISARLSMHVGRQVSLISRPIPKEKSAYKLAKPMTPAEVRYALGMKPEDPDPDFSSFSLGMLMTLSNYATPPGVLYDVYPLHIMTTSALEWISQYHPTGNFDVRRYRPSFLIETAADFQGIIENEWRGRELQIGSLRIACNHPTIRCSMPGAAQPGLENDPQIPLTLMKHAGQHLGAYATPINSAAIQVGDSVEMLPERKSIIYSWFDQVGRRAKGEVLKANTAIGNLIDKKRSQSGKPALPPGFSALQIISKTQESSDVQSITLAHPQRKALPRFMPGQHLVLAIVQADGKTVYRPYSISSGSHELSHYRISVKLKVNESLKLETDSTDIKAKSKLGEVSGLLHKQSQVGDTLLAKGPSGQFAILPTNNLPIVLISAGIGITPFMSMLQTLAVENPSRPVFLIHGIRSAHDQPFKAALEHLARQLTHFNCQLWVSGNEPSGSDSFNRSDSLNNPSDGDNACQTLGAGNLRISHGRIHLPQALSKLPTQFKNATYYICGTPSFSDSMREELCTLGVTDQQIQSESFGPPTAKQPKDASSHTIRFSQSGITTTWQSDTESLLSLAESNSIEANFGCRYGACQACEATLLSGEVGYADGIQPPAGKNRILLCCAQPKTHLEIAL